MLKLHSNIDIKKYFFGNELAPLLVVDNFIDEADKLVDSAVGKPFLKSDRFYPGIRQEVSEEYRKLLIFSLSKLVLEFFGISGTKLAYVMCHYSLVTTPAKELGLLQRIPHFDSLESNGLATVHYLFKKNLGGTAFYRHRKTGFEYIDESRKENYLRSLEAENGGPNIPKPSYINGSTPLFEQIAVQEGVFNRMLIYKRNSLHSGCISPDFIPDSDPRTGRLSINSFIDVL